MCKIFVLIILNPIITILMWEQNNENYYLFSTPKLLNFLFFLTKFKSSSVPEQFFVVK